MNTEQFEKGIKAGWSKGMDIANHNDHREALKKIEELVVRAQLAAKKEHASGDNDKAYYYRGYMAGASNADGMLVAFRTYGE